MQSVDDDYELLEAQVRILEQVHRCLTMYEHQMPQIASAYQAREWFMQHSNNNDKVRFVAACVAREEAEAKYMDHVIQKDKGKKVLATTMAKRDPNNVNVLPSREMVQFISEFEETREQDAIKALEEANKQWERTCTTVAAKCLAWINSLQHSIDRE